MSDSYKSPDAARKEAQVRSDLSTPFHRRRIFEGFRPDPDSFGKMTESFARFMGTPTFLLWMTAFCAVWLGWNTLAPESSQFDPRATNFTLLTLMLSLQASYAAPLLLLAQNRQDDRDRVALDEDRRQAARNLADTEYLTREVASLRIALRDVATRDFVRSELRDLLQEILEDRDAEDDDAPRDKREPAKRTRRGEDA
ncbi:DUF1003 domain-containing protein [Falsarthrobacter nasiphocae]|uniref:Membrane protein n=1 Tax=Falsarthrobacter nasiphocae TaxID=189863 RepID=A0AAE4C7I2_9MICC|nr:DUF1003 domain-containing protein [Falsarthrobacter nasiphocae]MDR6891475.1 putative membrane protein [Falsarthrobacter nasiphocae]